METPDAERNRDLVVRYMTHNDADFGYAVGIGGNPAYPVPGIPYKVLIGVDGKVLKMGKIAVSGADIEDALRRVRKLTPEEQEARAERILETAEEFIDAMELVRAEQILLGAGQKYAPSAAAEKCRARAAELAVGETKAEYDAQKELAKLIGVEKPAAKVDDKARGRLVKVLQAKAGAWTAVAPKAAALASRWVAVLENPWK